MIPGASSSLLVLGSGAPVGAGGPGRHGELQRALNDRSTVAVVKSLIGGRRATWRGLQERWQDKKHSTGDAPACHDADRALTSPQGSRACSPRQPRHFELAWPLQRGRPESGSLMAALGLFHRPELFELRSFAIELNFYLP